MKWKNSKKSKMLTLKSENQKKAVRLLKIKMVVKGDHSTPSHLINATFQKQAKSDYQAIQVIIISQLDFLKLVSLFPLLAHRHLFSILARVFFFLFVLFYNAAHHLLISFRYLLKYPLIKEDFIFFFSPISLYPLLCITLFYLLPPDIVCIFFYTLLSVFPAQN